MQTTVPQEVADVLTDMVNKGQIFTAYDVTQAARDKTAGMDPAQRPNIRHREVRDFVHSEFVSTMFGGTYSRSDIELNVAGNPRVICYHPDGKDPLDHPKALKPSMVNTPANVDGPGTSVPVVPPLGPIPPYVSAAQAASTAPVAGDGEVIVKMNADNRLCVPKRLLTQIKTQSGSFDLIVGGDLVARNQDADGRVRIPLSILRKAGTGDQFRISVDTTKNTISVNKA